ncbi:MAG: DUF2271 domain-containing protein [Treponema sp.]|nr:DUF2271 domain-containing protein [Treponema sp.]
MKIISILLLSVITLSCTAKAQSIQQETEQQSIIVQSAEPTAEITFIFTRQSGSASNQYAIWIEDAQGQFIKTLYATRWTANGGFNRRPTSIPLWVNRSGLSETPHEMIDTVSGATPRTGAVTYTWDGTNSRGVNVPAGNYVLVMEGTLRWENQVYYRAPITLGRGASTPQVSVEYVSGDRDTTAERSMISDVTVRVLR